MTHWKNHQVMQNDEGLGEWRGLETTTTKNRHLGMNFEVTLQGIHNTKSSNMWVPSSNSWSPCSTARQICSFSYVWKTIGQWRDMLMFVQLRVKNNRPMTWYAYAMTDQRQHSLQTMRQRWMNLGKHEYVKIKPMNLKQCDIFCCDTRMVIYRLLV